MGVFVPREFNAAEYFLDRLARQHPQRVAICGEPVAVRYGELAGLANRFGNTLRAAGCRPGDRVLIVLPDSAEFVAAFFGAVKVGAIAVPVNPFTRAGDYAYYLSDCAPRVAVVHAVALAEFQQALQTAQPALLIVVGASPPAGYDRPAVTWETLLREASDQLAVHHTAATDAAFFLYTSGSGGAPKAAIHQHKDMLVTTESFARGVLGLHTGDITFSVSKLFFAYGLGNALYFPFSVGATTILFPGRPEPARIFEVVKRYRPTLFFSVPTSYSQCLAAADDEEADFSSVRLCVSAGEALPRALYERWLERFGVEILDGIGSTEVLHIFISNRPGAVRPGSSGQIVPGYEARILDEEGRPVPVREIGNLFIKGDSTCAYYWNKHDKTKETILGEWIRTGDKYWVDEDGYYWYAGRTDDMLKVGGQWVSPVEIENTLIEHPAVLEAGVVGATDADGLTKPRAFVVLRPGYTPSPELAEELKDFVKSRIAPFKYPRWVEFVAELPKTATGKTQRFRLRQVALTQEER
uniref:Benzoate-CoA ligase family protein n=1 Tax=Agrobacterium albertimagni TaxID=147266 RepID=A0A7C1P1P5_9HYPH